MKFLILLSLLPAAISTTTASPRLFSTFSNITVAHSPLGSNSPGVLYARTTEISKDILLATWENYSPEPPLVYFPIHRSLDGGLTWTEISRATDQVNNWGLRYQPFLYTLPQPFVDYPQGTILLAGNSIPTDLSKTQIDLYASTDSGHTWNFLSHIAAGGRAIPNNGETPVWEPFLMLYDNQLVVYYSDQRDPLHGQKLVHQTTTDLKTWTPAVDDVSYTNFTSRPGMTTVTQLPDGNYIMTYEYGGGPLATDPSSSTGYHFPAYYRIAANPLEFNNSVGYPIIAQDGTQPTSSPYIAWSSVGGPNGSIIVSAASNEEVFVNRELGAVDAWEKVVTPERASYSRQVRVMKNNPDHVLLIGGGNLPPAVNNTVTVSVIGLRSSLE